MEISLVSSRRTATRIGPLPLIALYVAGIFAVIIVINVLMRQAIPHQWQAPIAGFIIFLPFAFFLLVKLHTDTLREEVESEIQEKLRKIFMDTQGVETKIVQRLFADESQVREIIRQLREISEEINRISQRSDSSGMLSVEDSTRSSELLKQKNNLERNLGSLQESINKDRKLLATLEYKNDIKERFKAATTGDTIEPVSTILAERAALIGDHELYGIYNKAREAFIDNFRGWKMESDRNLPITIGYYPPGNIGKELLAEEFKGLLRFELSRYLRPIVKQRIREQGLEFESYLLPLSFFLFVYFASFLITLPLINSIFTGKVQTTIIPLFSTGKSIPLLVVQWGFFGGLVYTSISLLNRFLRRDLAPRVYLLSSLRLLLSGVVAILIYFIYILSYATTPSVDTNSLPPQILVLVFVAGVAPIQLLAHFADTQLSKVGWLKNRRVAGGRPLTVLEGINAITAERLAEEGLDSVLHLALCNPYEIYQRTRFPVERVKDWKDQAILYTVSADVQARYASDGSDGKKNRTVFENLTAELGIRSWAGLKERWDDFERNIAVQKEELKSFFSRAGLVERGDNADLYYALHVFEDIIKEGKALERNQEKPPIDLFVTSYASQPIRDRLR